MRTQWPDPFTETGRPTPPRSLMHVYRILCLIALFAPTLLGADRRFSAELPTPSRLGATVYATREPGVYVCVPDGLAPDRLPYTPVFESRPQIAAPVDGEPRIAPRFEKKGDRFRAVVRVAQEDDLYGTGEALGRLKRNSSRIELWNTDNYAYEQAEGRRLYQSHPWVLGVRRDGSAYGLIFESTWKAELACDSEILFSSEGPAFPVYVLEGSSPKEVLSTLARLTGTLALPPRWALGYHQARWSYQPASEVLEVAGEFRRRRIPCDVLWMDIDYMEDYKIFTVGTGQFGDPVALNARLHDLRFRSVWILDPGVKAEPGYPVFDEGSKADVWVKTSEGIPYKGEVWPGICVFPDFTQPAARSWWAALYAPFLKQGADGIWNDMNEPAIFKAPDKSMPVDNRHLGGGEIPPGPHLRYRNVYGLLMARATREGILAARPERRPFVLTRANFLGGQRYAATWTGDNTSTDKHLRLSIPISLNLGLSGQPFSGPDLGGFGGNASPELWSRWIGFGAFFPFCRGHAAKGTNRKEPWAFGPEVENAARLALQRRYRLIPYLYTLFREASVDGLPVMRPLFLHDPRDPRLRDEDRAFMLGDDLVVRPAWAKDAPLPAGNWREVSLVPGDLGAVDQASLLVREGAIVPLGRVVENTGEESLAPLTLLVCPDASGKAEGRLYEDDGDGFGYAEGDYLLSTFRAERSGSGLSVTVAGTEGKRPRPDRQTVVVEVDARGQRELPPLRGL